MESSKIKCNSCNRVLDANWRVKNQKYCGRDECQRIRRRNWQASKMKNDIDYRKGQKDSFCKWYERNSHYFRRYRQSHPEYVEKNRIKQRQRDKTKGLCNHFLVKMDSLTAQVLHSQGETILTTCPLLVKMDSLAHKVQEIQEVLGIAGG